MNVEDINKSPKELEMEAFDALYDASLSVEEAAYTFTNRVMSADSSEDITESINAVIDALMDEAKPAYEKWREIDIQREGD